MPQLIRGYDLIALSAIADDGTIIGVAADADRNYHTIVFTPGFSPVEMPDASAARMEVISTTAGKWLRISLRYSSFLRSAQYSFPGWCSTLRVPAHDGFRSRPTSEQRASAIRVSCFCIRSPMIDCICTTPQDAQASAMNPCPLIV